MRAYLLAVIFNTLTQTCWRVACSKLIGLQRQSSYNHGSRWDGKIRGIQIAEGCVDIAQMLHKCVPAGHKDKSTWHIQASDSDPCSDASSICHSAVLIATRRKKMAECSEKCPKVCLTHCLIVLRNAVSDPSAMPFAPIPDGPPQLFICQEIPTAIMDSNLITMSTNLATMASALATMSSNLGTMGASLATTTVTNATSTAPSTAQTEGSRLAPIKQTVYVLTFTATNWQGPLDTGNNYITGWPSSYSDHGTLGVYVSRELAKDAGRRWSMKALDNRLKSAGLTDRDRSDLEGQRYVPETDKDGVWEKAWMVSGDYLEKPKDIFERLTVKLVGRVLETTTDSADGDDAKGKGKVKDEDEGQSQGQGAEGKAK